MNGVLRPDLFHRVRPHRRRHYLTSLSLFASQRPRSQLEYRHHIRRITVRRILLNPNAETTERHF